MRRFITWLSILLVAAMVVIPVSAQEERNLVEAAQQATGFDTLLAAAEAAGLADTLANEGPFTIFAPTNGGFANALASLGLTAEELLADTETLTTILSFHVVEGAVSSSDLIALIEDGGGTAEITTLGGETLTAEIVTIPVPQEEVAEGEPTPEPQFTDAIYLNRDNGQAVTVFATDINASNGVIHAISGVLLPPSMMMMDGGEEMAEEDMSEDMMETVPSVSVSDQAVVDGTVTVDSVTATEPGFIVIHADSGEGAPVPVAGFASVEEGENTDVVVELDTEVATPMLFAMLHVDTGEAGVYEFGEVEGDESVIVDGAPVTPGFSVEMEEMMEVTPSVSVSDQTVENGTVTVDSVTATEPGFIVIHADSGEGAPGPVAGFAPVEEGENTDVVVELDTEVATPMLFAMLHVDTGEAGVYEFGEVEGADGPVIVDGAPVTPGFSVEMPEAEESSDAGTIVDVAVASEDFTTLVAAVQAADLVEALSGEGPFTVFAPTDEAFEAALASLDMTAEDLLADTETLTAILTYHVVSGDVDSESLISLISEDGVTSVETLSGQGLPVGIEGDSIVLNDAGITVVTADVEASNGVIHVIDGVLLP